MSILTKKIIFFCACTLFIILSPLVVLYAMGYVFEGDSWSLVRTGSVRFVVNKPSIIKINGLEAGSTSFFNTSFQNTFGMSRVSPGFLDIEIITDKGEKWNKKINLRPSEFIDFPKIVIPDTADTLSFELVSSLSFKPNKMNLVDGFLYVYNDTNDKKSKNKDKAVRFDMRNVFLRSLVSSESLGFNIASISKQNINLTEFSGTINGGIPKSALKQRTFGGDSRTVFYDNSKIFIVWPRQTGYQPFIEANTVSRAILFDEQIKDVFWYRDGEHLIVLSGSKIYFIDIDFRGNIQRNIISENINGPIYYIDYQNSIYIIDPLRNSLYRMPIDF